MKNSLPKTLFVILSALFLTFYVFGQEATVEPEITETPDAEMTEVVEPEMTEEADMDMSDTEDDMEMDTTSGAIDITLEEIAGNSEEYFGQRVTVEGNVETFLNAKSFILGEEAIIDNDQLIVFNMTNETFDLQVSNDVQVVVTGVILPSLTFHEDGIDEATYWQPMEDIHEMMNFVVDPLQFYYSGGLEDQYDVYTVLVVEDVQNINVLSEDDGNVTDDTDMEIEATEDVDMDNEEMDMEATEEADS